MGGENQPPVQEKPDAGAPIDLLRDTNTARSRVKLRLLLQKSTGRGRKASSAQIRVVEAYREW
jgi:hypothetical protein